MCRVRVRRARGRGRKGTRGKGCSPLLILVPLVPTSKGHVDVGLATLVQGYQQASTTIAKTNGQARLTHLLVSGRGWERGEREARERQCVGECEGSQAAKIEATATKQKHH